MFRVLSACLAIGCTPADETAAVPSPDSPLPTDTADTADTAEVEYPPSLELVFSEPPVALPSGVRFASNVAYDDDEQTVFDVMLPDAAGPTPLVVFIHGGGFTGGDKSSIYGSNDIVTVLGAGAAYATINYRLLEGVDAEGVLKPLCDSRRALQFMRYHHEALNVDPEQVFLYGSSAGAGTALWLGSHDDMADPDAWDLIERESSRVRAVGILETQATYDLFGWEVIFEAYGLQLEDLDSFVDDQRLFSFYGVSSWEELTSSAITDYRAEVDMLEMLDASDAPLWIQSDNQLETEPVNTNILYHHPYHARAVMARARSVGLEEVSYIPELGIGDESGETMLRFFNRHLRD